MTATTGRCSVPASASSKPCAIETDAPMSTHVSMAESGGRAPQRVAADVARDDGLDAGRLLEHQPVRAAGAQRRRAGWQVGRGLARAAGASRPNAARTSSGRELAVARQPGRERRHFDAQRAAPASVRYSEASSTT